MQPRFNLLIEIYRGHFQLSEGVYLSRAANGSSVGPWSAGSANFLD